MSLFKNSPAGCGGAGHGGAGLESQYLKAEAETSGSLWVLDQAELNSETSCNLSTSEAEAGRLLLVQGQTELHKETPSQHCPCHPCLLRV